MDRVAKGKFTSMTTERISGFDMSDLKRNLDDCNRLHNAVGSLNPRNPGLHNKLIQFVKKVMRRSLSWYTRPLHQFHASVTRTLNELAKTVEQSEQLAGRLDQLADRSDRLEAAWRQNVPAFLNAVSTVGAFGHELVKIRREGEQGLLSVRQELSQDASNALQSVNQANQKISEEMEQGLRSVRQDTRQEMEQGLQSVRQDTRQEMEQGLQSVRGILQQTNESLASTWERHEFVRREIMYEMKYGTRTSGAASSSYAGLSRVEPKIISVDKIASARQLGVKLNLGCGHIALDGYINVDRRELPGVDVVGDVAELPFEEGSVQEIFSAHLLEHFPEEMLRRRLLPIWQRLLVPGGAFRAVVPDGEAMLAGVASGTYPFDNFREVLFGAQDYDGDFHFNLFTPESLCGLLQEAGFIKICVNARARPNGKCFEFEISAAKLACGATGLVMSPD
jgi:hypothetical protein